MTAALNREIRQEGEAEWHHFSSLYMILVGPGANLLEAVVRCQETSSSEIGANRRGCSSVGSEGSEAGTGFGMMGKNLEDRTSRRSI